MTTLLRVNDKFMCVVVVVVVVLVCALYAVAHIHDGCGGAFGKRESYKESVE